MNLTETLKHNHTHRPPFWFMRQAGRYLPEYREVRAKAGGFLELCYTPQLAAEVTLQPIRRFDMDAAIIFSDILVIPQALGMKLWFEEGEGPRLTPVTSEKEISALSFDKFQHTLLPVYEALRLTRAKLSPEKALIGFAGAPWTLACYMINGRGSKEYANVRQFAKAHKAAFSKLLDVLTDAISLHLSNQVQAGANALQIFDSWAGVLDAQEFEQYCVLPAQKIIAKVKALHPDIPIIGFPRGVGEKTLSYAKKTGVDGLSIDSEIDIEWAKKNLSPYVVVQGNLDNQLLAHDKAAALMQARHILKTFAGTPFIFNLGHGVLKDTPIENVDAVSRLVKEYS